MGMSDEPLFTDEDRARVEQIWIEHSIKQHRPHPRGIWGKRRRAPLTSTRLHDVDRLRLERGCRATGQSQYSFVRKAIVEKMNRELPKLGELTV
jgi:hypothetical protein